MTWVPCPHGVRTRGYRQTTCCKWQQCPLSTSPLRWVFRCDPGLLSVRKGRDHTDMLDPSLEHSLARAKCLLVGLRLPELHRHLLRVLLIPLASSGQRDILSTEDHFLVHPTGVREFTSSEHEEPARHHGGVHHPAVYLELAEGLCSRGHSLPDPLEHLHCNSQASWPLHGVLLQGV